jgi:hypothetical protein
MKKWMVILIIIAVLIPAVFAMIPLEPKETITKEPTKPTPTPTETPLPEPKEIPVRIAYEGNTSIKNAIAAKSQLESANVILSTATKTALKDVVYPYNLTSSKTEETKTIETVFKIQKYRCDEKTEICGYWIEAWRDGKEVKTNSPIWISPPPYEVVISDIYYTALDEKEITTDISKAAIEVVTLKEDPKLATEQALQQYVDRQPLGKAVVGTKE